MCPNELVFAVTSLAAALAEGRNADETALLGTIITQLGDTLSTIAQKKALCESNK